MNYALQRLRTTPLSKLRVDEHAFIALQEYMTDVRAQANAIRLAKHECLIQGYRHTLTYLIGRVHGLCFGVSSAVIYGSGHYDDFADACDVARAECDFLSGAYQEAAK